MKYRKSLTRCGAIGVFCYALLSSPNVVFAQNNYLNSPQSNLAYQFNGNESFEKVEEYFFKELYPQLLIEASNAQKQGLSSTQKELLDFYKAISSSYMLKDEAQSITEDFIQKSSNTIHKNIAAAILAEQFLANKDYDAAKSAFEAINRATLSKSMDIRYNFYYGKYFFETEQYPEARYRFNEASSASSVYADELDYYLSYIKYNDKDYDGAMEGFSRIANKSKFAKANIYIAQMKFQNGDYKYIVDNIDDLTQFAKGDDTNVELTRLVAESYYNLGNYPESLNWMKKYQQLGGELNREQNYIMGYGYYMNNQYDESIKYFTKIIDGSNQMGQSAYYHLADAYLKIKDKKGALRAFSMASSMDYNKEIAEDALYNQVKLSYETGAGDVYSRLIELMQRYLTKYPNNEKRVAEINGYLLGVYINSGDYDNALLAIKRVVNPSSAILEALQRVCYVKGLEKVEEQDYNEAIKLFDKTIEYNISPAYGAMAQYWKAEAIEKSSHDSDKAIAQFKKYITLSTPAVREHQFSHYNIAYIYFNDKDWSNATTWFNKFIDMYKSSDQYLADAFLRLGDISFGHRDYSKAISYYTSAQKINPSNSDYAQYQIAVGYGLSGKVDNKISQLKKIVAENKSVYSQLALVELAATYNKSNRYKDGEATLKTFVANNQNSPYYVPALLEMGVATANQNKNSEALDYYKRVVKENAHSTEAKDALLAIKSIYVSQGDVNPYFEFMSSVNLNDNIDASQKENLSFEALQQRYLKNSYKSVISQAKVYRKEFRDGAHSNDVTYYLAESLMKNNQPNDAIKEFEHIISLPTNQYTSSALAYAESIYAKRGDLSKQYMVNEKLYGISGDVTTKQKALDKMIKIALDLDNDEITRAAYIKVLADKNATKESVSFAQFAKGKEAFKAKDYVTAFAALRKSGLPLSVKEGAEGEYMKAVILFSEKKYNDTEEFIITLSKRGTPHQYWLAKSFILLGDTYVERGDLFQAKATYQSIIDGYENKNDGIIKLAKEKSAKLGSTTEQ